MKKISLVTVVWAGLCCGAAIAVEQPTALFLLDAQPNVRLYSMGGALSGLNQGDSVYNPWELGYTVNTSLYLAHWPGAVIDSKYNFLSVVAPFRRLGVFSLSYLNYGTGSETIEELDGTQRRIKLEDDKIMAISYGVPITQTLFVGGGIKSLTSTLAEDYKATALLFDMGLVYRTLDDKHSFGVAMVNRGGGLKYYETTEPVPAEYKFGYTRKLRPYPGQKLVLGLGYAKSSVSKTISVGAEYQPGISFVSIRCGASRKTDVTVVTAGLGLNYNSVDLDVGYDLSSTRMEKEQTPLRFALSWSFGGRGDDAMAEKYMARGMKKKAMALRDDIK